MTYTHANIKTLSILPLIAIVFVFVMGIDRLTSVTKPIFINYYHSDHLGSSTVVTNASGSVVENTAYYPFGATRSDTGIVNVRHKFTGQEYDAETGLYFYNARYYDPVLGRFISADTIIPYPNDPQSFNRYSYCGNNPVRYVDPSGHFLIIQAIIAGLFGGAIASANHGDFWKGFLTGFISSMFFQWAGDLGGGFGNHAIMGMLSGGVNASIMGGDVGKGIVTGGFAGGFGEITGNMIQGINGDDVSIFLGSTIAGGTTSGIIAMMYGGDFWEGFGSGALIAAAGDLYNRGIHGPKVKPPKVRGAHNWGDETTLKKHYADHGADFGAKSADEYAEMAEKFLRTSQTNKFPTKIDAQGNIRVYDSKTNTFGSYNPDGSTKTFYKPQPRSEQYPRGYAEKSAQEYWEKQPGTLQP